MQWSISNPPIKQALALNKDEKRNKRIIFALCSILFVPAINNFLNLILRNGFSIHLEILTPASYIFMACMSGFVLYPHIFRKKALLGFFLFFLMGTVLSCWLYPEIQNVIYSSPVDLVYSPVNKLFFFCFPSLVGVACLRDFNGLFESMGRWSRWTVFLGVFAYVFLFFYVGVEPQYMVYSYYMLLPIIVCYENAKNENRKDLLFAVVGTVAILMCGARGAVVSLLMYFMLRILSGKFRKISGLKALQMLAIFLLLFFAVLFYHEMLAGIISLFERVGINSRFIIALSENMLLEDSGRSRISASIFEGIRYNPIGYGLYGDRYVTGTFGFGGYQYAHNILMELLCDFGVIGGCLIILLLGWRFARLFSTLRNEEENSLMMALIPYGVFQLFFSSSYLENVPFFILLGMAFFVNWRRLLER